ncbi:hypothetical protein E4K10_33165 [Streptomyces sp. T1317-0309]|nr:hypothetical protein E4K10_33165 [Streptomyces sp. T1317-0309]
MEAFEGEDPETPAEARLIGRKIEKLEAEIKELEQRVSDLSAPNPLRAVFAPGPDAAARWEVADVTVQRAIAALLFAPHGPLGQPRVRRFVDSASEAVQDRLEWVTDEAV